MSWFDRDKDFTAHTPAKAAEVDAEFDNIADALNEIAQAGDAVASATPAIGAAYADIAGANETIDLPRDSLVLVHATFDVSVGANDTFYGALAVDGTREEKEARWNAGAGGGTTAGTKEQSWLLELAAGSHDLKLQAKRNGVAVSVFDKENTGFTWLAIPDPEP